MSALSSLRVSGEPNEAHIPVAFQAPALMISSAPTSTEVIPTIFVGIVDNIYTEDHWSNHRNRIERLLEIPNGDLVGEIKVGSRDNETIDGENLALDMKNAVTIINSKNFNSIRIIGMGVHGCLAVIEALESLVHSWKLPLDQKKVHFIALGDSIDNNYLNLCKMLCLKQICRTVQFYNTMDYNMYGFVDSTNARLLSHHLHQMHAQANRPEGSP